MSLFKDEANARQVLLRLPGHRLEPGQEALGDETSGLNHCHAGQKIRLAIEGLPFHACDVEPVWVQHKQASISGKKRIQGGPNSLLEVVEVASLPRTDRVSSDVSLYALLD